MRVLIKTNKFIFTALFVVTSLCFNHAQDTEVTKGIVLDDGSDSIQSPQLFSNYILKDEDGKFNIKLTDSDAKSALHRLAKEAEVNIVIPEDLDSRININLSDVNFDLALKAVLKSTPYRYTLDEGIYFIELASSKHIEAEQVFSKRFPIVNANIDDVYTAISEAYGSESGAGAEIGGGADGDSTAETEIKADVNIILDKSNSAIVAQGSQEVIAQIEDLITLLDLGPDQVIIEATFVTVTINNGSTTGINWSQFQSYTADLNFSWTGLFGRDFLANFGPPSQSSTLTSGFPVNGDSPVQSDVFGGPAALGEDISAGNFILGGDNAPYTTVLNPIGNRLLLDFLKTDINNKVIANPRITTSSSVSAKMSVAEEIPIPEFEINAETGNTSISGFEFREVGIILDVTPKVNPDNSITLEVKPESSSPSGSNDFLGVSIPNIRASKLETTVTVGSGETIVMGGLIQNTKNNDIKKVPFLGDLPFLGKAFTHTTESDSSSNLMIFITATLIPAKGQLSDTISDQEIIDLGMDKNEFLPYKKREKKVEEPKQKNLNTKANQVKARDISEVRSTSF